MTWARPARADADSTAGEEGRSVPERRAEPRVAARIGVRLHLADLPAPLAARCSDIGTGGICVRTPTRFLLRALRRIEVELPERTLELHAEGCWQRELAAEDGHRTGIRFLAPAEEESRLLWRFVQQQAGQLATFLAAHTELGALEIDDANDLALVTRIAEVPAGRWVYQQGVRGPGAAAAYLVCEGAVRVEVRNAYERVFLIERVGVGGLIGGQALIAAIAPPESAITEVDSLLLEVDRPAFAHLEWAKPRVANLLARTVIRKQSANLCRLVDGDRPKD